MVLHGHYGTGDRLKTGLQIMSKRKKRRKAHRPANRPSAKLMRETAAALELYEEGEEAAARQKLLQLVQRYPRNKAALLALLEVCQESDDWRTFVYYGEQLLQLERGEERAETLNNLVYAHIRLMYPALAWHYANEMVVQHADFEHIEKVKSLVATSVPILLEEFEKTTDSTTISEGEKLERMALHDRMRFYTESGYAEDAIGVAELLLENEPDSISVLNNLSLAQFIIGNVEEAKAAAQKVISQDPENFHALGNLVRYHFLTARFDEAEAFAGRLQQISSDHPDFELKQAEAFAFLGDDQQVWGTYERAKEKYKELPPLHLHLAAAASYRLGGEKTAWKLWRQAVKLLPSFELAQECLAEKRLPVGEREVPWYWSFQYWFSEDLRKLLTKHLGTNMRRMNERSVERGMKSLLAERPYLPQLLPHMLERGDQQTREFALNFLYMIATPELQQTCYDFAQSRHGSDDLRMEAMQYISENHPGMLPEDKQVPMWINGRQVKLFMMGFEITDEPLGLDGIPEAILDKHKEAYDLLMDGETEAAELLLHEIIAEAPDFRSAYNQLAVAYQMQGQEEKVREMVEETHARFPDYFFARVALARMMVDEKRLEEARDLVEPLLRLPKLHISEFRALAEVQMEIALAVNQIDAARSWLEMWQQIEEDNPDLLEWKMRIDGPGFLKGLQDLLGRSRDR